MLTGYQDAAEQASITPSSQMSHEAEKNIANGRGILARIFRIEWLGQTVASLCWIASVFTYGIAAPGDWLQLCAASAWLMANIASIAIAESD